MGVLAPTFLFLSLSLYPGLKRKHIFLVSCTSSERRKIEFCE